MDIPKNERIEDPCKEMARLAQDFLPLNQWGFTEIHRSMKDERLIYASQLCQVKFVWSGWDAQAGNSISIYYGRLHAPADKQRLVWNGEECHCWHDLIGMGAVLDFLDGLTPAESVDQDDFPQVIEQFRDSELWQKLAGKRRNPELAVRMHGAIWQHYGLRLFELFDLNRPDLWEQYMQFLKQIYDIKGRSSAIKPPLDKVC